MKIIDFLMTVRKIPTWDRIPPISNEDLEDLINQADMAKEKGRYNPYPILGSKPQQYIPCGLLTQHDGRAWKNHGQSLSQLAQRGGLGWAEALAIIENKSWKEAEHDDKVAEDIVRKMVAEYMKGQFYVVKDCYLSCDEGDASQITKK